MAGVVGEYVALARRTVDTVAGYAEGVGASADAG